MALSTGSFAFVGYNADGEDDFAIVLLEDITTAETVFFTDDEWNGSAFNGSEGILTWTTPGTLAAGTVITFSNTASVSGLNTTVATVSHGSLDQTNVGGGFVSIASSGDSILAYQGSIASPSFIAGIAYDEDGFGQSGGTLTGTGLTLGLNAIELGGGSTSPDGGEYSGTRDSGATFSDYGPIINNAANWTTSLSDGESLLPLDNSTFTTGAADTTPPLLASTSPIDGGVNVAVSDNLSITFNEAIQAGSGTITIRRTDDNSIFETITVPSGAVTFAGSTATINPTGNLETATRYHVEISTNAIQDLAGNAFAGINDVITFNFSTALPTIGPAPAALGPGSIGFVGFSTEGQTDDLAIVALTDLDGSTTAFNIYITDQPWTGSALNTSGDGTIIWTIDELIPAGTIINLSDLGSEATSNTSSFTASHGFISRDSEFGPSSSGETVLAYVGTLEAPSTFLAGIATDELGFTHSGGTLTGTGLTEGMTAANFGALEDGLDGASYVGDRSTEASFAGYLDNINGGTLSSNYNTANGSTPPNDNGEDFSPFPTTSFTVAGPDLTPPALASTSPADQDEGIVVEANLTATFNENVQLGTGNITIFSKVGDIAVETIDVTSGLVTVLGDTITINPANDLDLATAYYIQVDPGAIEDTSGNDFAGIANESDWNFTTTLPATSVPAFGVGDIAFTGYNTSGDEDISFVALTDLDGSTNPFQIFFTDNGWDGAALTNTEGTLTWTVTSLVSAGTVVTFTDLNNPDSPEFQASVGLLQESGSFNMATSGDVLFAYTGALGSPASGNFLAALTNDNLGFNLNSGGLTNTGLTLGQNAISLSDGTTTPDGGEYTGARDTQSVFSDYNTLVNNSANWTLTQSNGENTLPLDDTSFALFNTAADAVDDAITVLDDLGITSGIDLFAANPTTADNDAEADLFSIISVQGGMSPRATDNGGTVTVTDASNGIVSYNPNNAFEHLPDGVTDTDTFTYTITGGDTATVTITVTGVDNDDTFNGTGGGVVDTINAGVGADTVFGRSGNDILNGESGDDTINGGNGSDTINGGDNNDELFGANGDDIINGGNGSDLLKGNLNRDELNGDAGNDFLFGGSANDALNGGSDDDNLFGEQGNDRLDGGSGDDVIRGGADSDIFIFNSGNEIDRIRDWQDGVDFLDFSDFNLTKVEVLDNAIQVGSNVRFFGFGGSDILVVENEILANITDLDIIV